MGIYCSFVAVTPEALERFQGDPESIEDFLCPENGGVNIPNSLDINKSWHGIHYLLTGSADPGLEVESRAVLGGEDFGPDLGHGSATFLLPPEVATIARYLSRVSAESLAAHYNPEDMKAKDIYLFNGGSRDPKDIEFLIVYYRRLQDFYTRARLSKRHCCRVKTTSYFRAIRSRLDRAVIKDEWIERAIQASISETIQTDGRIRRWVQVPEMGGRVLRVVLLPDGQMVHNAFFDRRFSARRSQR